MPLTTADIIDSPKNKRAEYLRQARYWGEAMFVTFLFCFAVSAFKARPTKKKAIFIWKTFLEAGMAAYSFSFGASGKLELSPGDVTREDILIIKTSIDICERMAAQAARMNRVSRFFSSSDRAVPPTIFDVALESIKKAGGALTDVKNSTFMTITAPRAAIVDENIETNLPALKTDFQAGGFALDDVGLA